MGGIKRIRAIAIIRADSQFKFHAETIERKHRRQKYTHLAGQQTKTKPKRPRGRWKSQHTTKSKTKGTREKTSELTTSPKRKELPREVTPQGVNGRDRSATPNRRPWPGWLVPGAIDMCANIDLDDDHLRPQRLLAPHVSTSAIEHLSLPRY